MSGPQPMVDERSCVSTAALRQRHRCADGARTAVYVLTACAVLVGCGASPPTPSMAPVTSAGSHSPEASPAGPRPGVTTAPSTVATPRGSPQLTSQGLRDAIGVTAIRAHLAELQGIADANGGNRATGTAGFDASVEYVASTLEAAGYEVERQAFSFEGGTSVNLIAERSGSDGGDVVILGAHVDSVPDGPGINDNGSGSMSLLVLAEELAAFEAPARTVRFAFWGAEEPGRLGSNAYVASLTADERQRLIAYLNLDLIGSPNFIRFVYADAQAAPGSQAITQLFADHFASVGLALEAIDLTGKSDHAAFAAAGIPTGGLFSGGREPKTDAQAATFGGTAGVPADACADHACDTTDNISDIVLEQMADAAAHALVTLASD